MRTITAIHNLAVDPSLLAARVRVPVQINDKAGGAVNILTPTSFIELMELGEI